MYWQFFTILFVTYSVTCSLKTEHNCESLNELLLKQCLNAGPQESLKHLSLPKASSQHTKYVKCGLMAFFVSFFSLDSWEHYIRFFYFLQQHLYNN